MARKWLPDAIMLQIMLASDVRTMQNMRLACRAFYALMEAYSNSIVSTIHLRHGETTWKYFSIAAPKKTPLRIAFELDRRIRTAKWIAAMALRDQPIKTPQGPNASEPYYPRMDFHDMFDYIVVGLGIIWHLSSIFKAGPPCDRQGIRSWTSKYRSDVSTDSQPIIETNNDIARQQFDYICALDDEGLKAYYHSKVYCTPVLYCMRAGVEIDKHDPHGPGCGKLCQWYSWFILQEGPEFFVDAWGSVDGNERCVERLLDARKGRNEEQYNCETEWLQDVIRQRYYRNLGGGFNDYAELVVGSEEERWRMVEGWIEESGLDGGEMREGNDWRTAVLTLRWASISAKRNAEKNKEKKRGRRGRVEKKVRDFWIGGGNKCRFGT
ncbi:hypothetical protein K458DRAFT_416628 [Lentithecium fluviatile CBS 122367]|uniref:F-box domain-containing protein n=1 Tax=Lentithecium fluviatile CBS 122367 TaxID=1168545 RepID=A0A6G1J7V9_9PLEO|nr:hypothetical protein K458DRAFT_416628 [Lentithecium fluviatile CBS 122367]